MKTVLKQAALRVPLVASVMAKRHALFLRLRRLLGVGVERSAAARLHALRKDVGRLLRVSPAFVATTRQGFAQAWARAQLPDPAVVCQASLRAKEGGSFHLRRFCLCCNESMPLLVDHQYGGLGPDGRPSVNWRERLVCPGCGMNNRQRLVAKLVQQATQALPHPRVYLMEQVTPIFEWVRALDGVEVHGSEYLGPAYRGGEQVNGVRHEDVMNLSYSDGSFDLIVSNDVMEHIPDPERALQECFRVLRPGGSVIATFPFHVASDVTRVRARLAGEAIEHLHPPEYHGNPVSSEGSLVFHDFGWDLFDAVRRAGFTDAACECYASDAFGHLGPGLIVFRLTKASGPASQPAHVPGEAAAVIS